jgi:acetyltransferase-like isoleucine patch superfamily enzyme
MFFIKDFIKLIYFKLKYPHVNFIGLVYMPFKNNIKFGKNVKIGRNVYITDNVSIGDNSYVNDGSIVSAEKGGSIEIGKNVSIGHNVFILTLMRDLSAPSLYSAPRIPHHLKIEDDVWVGSGSILLKSIKVGKSSVIGAGSIVTKNVEPYSVVGGNPAKFIKYRK